MLNKDKIDQILRELHFMDSSIDLKDEKLITIVGKMLKYKPIIEDKTFKLKLKKALLKEISSNKKRTFSYGIFKSLAVLLSGTAFTYAVFTVTNPMDYIKPLETKPIKEENISKISGDLAQINKQSEEQIFDEKIAKPKTSNLAQVPRKVTNTEITKTGDSKALKTEKNDEITNKEISDNNDTLETTDNLETADMMMKSSRMSDDAVSDSDFSADDSSFTEPNSDATITSDSMSMGLMMTSEEKTFQVSEFIEFLDGSDSAIIDILKSSEISVLKDILNIKTKTQENSDFLNKSENISFLSSKIKEFGFEYKINITSQF